MDIIVNGQTINIPESVRDIEELLDHLSLNKDLAIVEQNGVIFKKESWHQTRLANGDRLEIVQFVGGG